MIGNNGFTYIKKSMLFILTVFFIFPLLGGALEPNEILVIANKNAAHSVGLAKYYMDQRSIFRCVECGKRK